MTNDYALKGIPTRSTASSLTALQYFALNGTGHADHQEQGNTIRRYITCRNNYAYDERLRRIVDWAT